DGRHWPTAAWAARQGYNGLFVDVVRGGPVHAGMAGRSPGPLLGAIGELLGLASPERGRLTRRGPRLLVELLLQLSVPFPEVADGLLQGGDLGTQLPVLLAELFESRPLGVRHGSTPLAALATWPIPASKSHAAKHVPRSCGRGWRRSRRVRAESPE